MNVQIVWEQVEADKAAVLNSVAAREILPRSARRVVLHFFDNHEIGGGSRRKVAGCISSHSI
jgi:hypothetical protein